MIKLTGISLGLAIAASFAVATGTLTTTAFSAAHKAAVIKTAELGGHKVFTNAKGMTLYTFDKDMKGKSNCNGGCAAKWPPVKAKVKGMMDGKYSVITRKDGSLQWAYKGHPLYTWIKDKKVGQMTGDGVKGVWHTARP